MAISKRSKSPTPKKIKSTKIQKEETKLSKSVDTDDETSTASSTTATTTFIVNQLDPAVVNRASDALLKYIKKELKGSLSEGHKSNLFVDDVDDALSGEYIYIQLGLNRIPSHANPTPKGIRLPHSIYAGIDQVDTTKNNDPSKVESKNLGSAGNGDVEVCLIVKDDSKAIAKRLVAENQYSIVGDVVTLTELRKDYKRFEDKRNLRNTYDMFLADDRIVNMLLRTLGGTFVRRKKLPVPIRIANAIKTEKFSKLRAAVNWALHTTTYTIPAGASLTIKIGHAGMSSTELVENITAALSGMIPNIPNGGWRNIKSIGIRSSQSITLPIYNQIPEVFVPKELLSSGEETLFSTTGTGSSKITKKSSTRSISSNTNINQTNSLPKTTKKEKDNKVKETRTKLSLSTKAISKVANTTTRGAKIAKVSGIKTRSTRSTKK